MSLLLSDPLKPETDNVSLGMEVAPTPTPIQEAAQAEIASKAADKGPDLVSAAIRTDWASSFLADNFGSYDFIPNPQWNPADISKEDRKELGLDNRPPEYTSQILEQSVSKEHALAISKSQDERLQAENILSNAGMGGMAVRLGVSFLDPSAIALTVATEGALGPLVYAEKASRINRAVRMGLLNAGQAGLFEAGMNAIDPLRDESSIAYGMVAGMFLGAGIGALTHSTGRGVNEITSTIDQGRMSVARSLDTAITMEEARLAGIDPAPGVVPPPAPDSTSWAVHLGEDGVPRVVHTSPQANSVEMPSRDALARLSDEETFKAADDLEAQKAQHTAALEDATKARTPEALASHPDVAAIDNTTKLITKSRDELSSAEVRGIDRQLAKAEQQRTSLLQSAKDKGVPPSAKALAKLEAQITKLADEKAGRLKSVYDNIAGHNKDLEELAALREAKLKQLMQEDTPAMAEARAARQKADEGIRDLAPKITAAFSKADAEIAKRPLTARSLLEETQRTSPASVFPSPKITIDHVEPPHFPSEEWGVTPATAEAVTPPPPPTTPVIETSGGAAGNVRIEHMTSTNTEAMERNWLRNRISKMDVGWRKDLYSFLAGSNHPGVSWFVDQLLPDPVGFRENTLADRVASAARRKEPLPEGAGQARAVLEEKEMLLRTTVGKAMRDYYAAYNAWAAEVGHSMAAYNAQARAEFGEAVGLYITDPSMQVSEAIRKAARAIDEVHATLGALAKQFEVEGFKEFTHDPRYLMRKVSWAKFNKLNESGVGDVGIIELVTNAIKNKAVERRLAANNGLPLTQEQRDAISDAASKQAYLWVQWQKHSAFHAEEGMGTAFNKSIVNKLKEKLITTISEHANDTTFGPIVQRLGSDDIENFVSTAFNVGQAGVIGRGKYRIDMDEAASLTLNGQTIRMTDFLERDAERLMMGYAQEMTGAIALAKNPELQIKSMSHWDQMLGRIQETSQRYFGADTAMAKEQQDSFELIRRALFGQALDDMSGPHVNHLINILRDFNFVRLMGKAGLAQATELGNVLGQAGWMNTIRHMPVLKSILRDAETGALDNDLLDTIELTMGVGTDRLLSAPSARDLTGLPFRERVYGKIENALSVGKRVVSDFSGLGPLTDAMERLAVAGAIQRFAKMALNQDGLSPQRLMAMGLNPSDTKLILEQMRKHTKDATGSLTGRTVKTLGFENWDPGTLEKFRTALWRWSRKMIQKTDVGDMPMFMSKKWAQIVFQFRAFSIAAWPKQLIHGIAMRDAQTVSTFLSTTLFGGLGYVALTYVNSIGEKDPEKFRKERLTPAMIGANSFARAGYSSVLPGAIDSVIAPFNGSMTSPLAMGRTTGLKSNNPIVGNPTYDAIYGGVEGMSGLLSNPFADRRQFSQKDAAFIARMTPMANLWGISSGVKLMSSYLPDKSALPK